MSSKQWLPLESRNANTRVLYISFILGLDVELWYKLSFFLRGN